jgi:hypothetical protein
MTDQITPTMVQAAASVLWNTPDTEHLAQYECEELAKKILQAAMKARHVHALKADDHALEGPKS